MPVEHSEDDFSMDHSHRASSSRRRACADSSRGAKVVSDVSASPMKRQRMDLVGEQGVKFSAHGGEDGDGDVEESGNAGDTTGRPSFKLKFCVLPAELRRKKIQKVETDYAVHFMSREAYNEERFKLYTEDEAKEACIVWPREEVHVPAAFREHEIPRSPAGFREFLFEKLAEPDWRPRMNFQWPFSLMNRDLIDENNISEQKKREADEAIVKAEAARRAAEWAAQRAQQEAKLKERKAKREALKAKQEAEWRVKQEAEGQAAEAKLLERRAEELREGEEEKILGTRIQEMRQGVAEAEKLLEKMKQELRVEVAKREAAKEERMKRWEASGKTLEEQGKVTEKIYDPKPHQCTICNKKFTTAGGLRQHTADKHKLVG